MITAPTHPERPALKMTADVRFNPDTLEVEHVDGEKDKIDLHTGLRQRAEHTGVVHAIGAGPGQDDGRAELR